MTPNCDRPDSIGDGQVVRSVNQRSADADYLAQCSRFEQVLASRSESLINDALRQTPVTLPGLSIVRSEAGLSLRHAQSRPNQEQCTALRDFVDAFVSGLPRISLAERFEVFVRRQMQNCTAAVLSLPAKRRSLKALAWLRLWLMRRQAAPAAQLRYQQALVSCLLHEPDRKVRRLWLEHMTWNHLNYARRLIHLQNRHDSDSHLSTFVWPDEADYRRVIQNNNASRVLLSIHMGDFFGAFRVLSAVSDPGRRAISLRRDKTPDHAMQNIAAGHIAHQTFYHGQHQPAAIVGALRRGRHTLATLFDLKDDFGSTVVVNFFGHRARFVKGPVQLAILGRSRIFPFVCFDDQGKNCIEMAAVIDTRLQPGESLHHGTVRITQALVTLAEGWIRRHPAQWKYLPMLPAYFETAH